MDKHVETFRERGTTNQTMHRNHGDIDKEFHAHVHARTRKSRHTEIDRDREPTDQMTSRKIFNADRVLSRTHTRTKFTQRQT